MVYDIRKKWTQHDLIMKKLDRFGKTLFVDFADGSDGNTGETPNSPMQSLDAALDFCTAGAEDYIFCRGFKNFAAFGKQTIDVESVHIIGTKVGRHFTEECGLYTGTAVNEPIIDITAVDVELAGMDLDARWVASTRTINSDTQIEALEISGDGVGGGVGCYIHDMRFPGWYAKTGILVRGAGYCEFANLTFDDFATYTGMYFESDGVNNPTDCMFENIRGNGNKYLIEVNTNNMNRWRIHGLYGNAVGTALMYVGSNATTYGQIKTAVGDVAGADLFKGGAAAGHPTSIANATSRYGITLADCWGSDGPLVA